ncbi:MAG: hypothetical protein GY950_08025 [bacterium]|nr:hypothetical protein [bacterium]
MKRLNKMFKKDFPGLLEKTFAEIEALNYVEQFLDLFPGFFTKHLPVSNVTLFFPDIKEAEFIPYPDDKHSHLKLDPVSRDSNLVTYLENAKKPVVLKDEKPSRIHFLKKTDPGLFEQLQVDIVIPLFSIKRLYGFVVVEADKRTYRELEAIGHFFKIFSNILIPLVTGERSQIENSRNYYKIYRMDRLAMVGELAASAAHEIKNPLAGISTFLKYFRELEDFKKEDIIEELGIMKDSVQRIDEIVKSLLSFSRFKKRKIGKINLSEIIESSLNSIALKIPANITVTKKLDDDLDIESDSEQLRQVLVNVLFNAAEAIGTKAGEITIFTNVSGRDRLPSKEMFNIAVKDNGPGIPDDFKEKLFQPFQTTKEEGTGLGLYTCYGLMKSLGGGIKISSNTNGTEVILSLPYSFDDDED